MKVTKVQKAFKRFQKFKESVIAYYMKLLLNRQITSLTLEKKHRNRVADKRTK